MPYKEKPIEKKYYTIGEAAEKLSCETYLIRFWEKCFPEIKPKKYVSGRGGFMERRYTEVELERLFWLKDMANKYHYNYVEILINNELQG